MDRLSWCGEAKGYGHSMEGFLEEAKLESGGALLRAEEEKLTLRVLQRGSLPTHIDELYAGGSFCLRNLRLSLTCKVEKILLAQSKCSAFTF